MKSSSIFSRTRAQCCTAAATPENHGTLRQLSQTGKKRIILTIATETSLSF
jgi:hypothetical protein